MEQGGKKKYTIDDLINQTVEILKDGPKTWPEIYNLLSDGENAISKGTGSKLKNRMEELGLVDSPGRGKPVTLKAGDAAENEATREKSTKTTVEKWLIMFIMNRKGKPMTFSEIRNAFFLIPCFQNQENEKHLRHLITALMDEKMLMNKDGTYYLADTAPIIVAKGIDDLEQYVRLLSMESSESIPKEVMRRVNVLVNGKGEFAPDGPQISGRYNDLPAISLRNLDKLLALPYKKKRILVTSGQEIKKISVGIIFYSRETNEFYVLSVKNGNGVLTRLSSVSSFEVTDEDNDICMDEVSQYYEEMLGPEVDKLYDVKIRFKNFTSIMRKIQSIAENRASAHIEENGNEFIYTDQVRGLGILSRILRGIGPAAIVESPEELKEKMINTALKIEHVYSKEVD